MILCLENFLSRCECEYIYIWAKVKHLDICEPLSAEIKRKISTHLHFIHQDVSLNNAVLTSYMALVSTREKSLWQP